MARNVGDRFMEDMIYEKHEIKKIPEASNQQ
jgi:hypothetical protein